jgi:hypothetical protein
MMVQVKRYFTLEAYQIDGRGRRPLDNRLGGTHWRHRCLAGADRPAGKPRPPKHPEEGPMTTVLLVLTFLLLLDVLVLLGRSHDSRDGRDWQPRGSPSPVPTTVALDR